MDDEIKITKRCLPHWTQNNAVYFITFSLMMGDELDEKERNIVFNHVVEGNNKYYRLHILVVMPDHVHLILNCLNNFNLSDIMKGTKGVSAHLINKYRNTKGSVWLDESFDRIIRDEKEFDEKMVYIYNNAFKKGLVENPDDYKWLFVNSDVY